MDADDHGTIAGLARGTLPAHDGKGGCLPRRDNALGDSEKNDRTIDGRIIAAPILLMILSPMILS